MLANRSSHKPSSMSALENRRTSDYDTTSTYLSTAFTGTGERTLRSLLHSSKPLFATESSTSSAEMSSASDVIQPSSVSATDETQGFNISSQAPGFVERSTDSHPLSERASPGEHLSPPAAHFSEKKCFVYNIYNFTGFFFSNKGTLILYFTQARHFSLGLTPFLSSEGMEGLVRKWG